MTKSMGDLANERDCEIFSRAFSEDVIAKWRVPFLDEHFADRVSYYLATDRLCWSVNLYVSIRTDEEGLEYEHFRVESATAFFPTADDCEGYIAEAFGISVDEVARRLAAAASSMNAENA